MSKRKLKIVITAFFLLILAGAGYYITNGFKDTPQAFYVEYGGNRLTDNTSITLEDSETRFDCKTIIGSSADFSVSVVPYHSNKSNFEFSVDDRLYIFSGISADFTAAFNTQKHDGYFTITPKGNMSELLKTVYPNKAISVPDLDYTATEYFSLVIIPASGKAITIPFKYNFGIRVQSITLDKEKILI